MNKLLNKLYINLENNNINYCVLRKYNLSDGDIDLMLFHEDLSEFELIMNKYKAVKVSSSLYIPHVQYHMPYIENNTVKYLIFDCIFDFVFGKNMNEINVLLDKKDFISRLQKTNNQYFKPSYEYATVFLAIHIFLENKSTKQDERFTELSEYFEKSDKVLLDKIIKGISINNKKLNDFNMDTINSVFASLDTKKNIKIITNFYTLKGVSYLRRKLFNREGLVVSFIGVDGTGKSTLSEGVCELLKLNANNIVEIVYLGDRKSFKKVGKLKDKYRNKINKNGIVFKAYKIASLLSYFLKRLILSFKLYYRSRNKFILSDRFILDRLLPSPNTIEVNSLHIKVLKLFKKMIKLPDIIYFLDGDAQKISSRKDEYSYLDTLNGMKFQKEVLNKASIKYKTLNTTEDAINEIKKEVLIDVSNKKRGELFNA
jgi:thymidylate kinase